MKAARNRVPPASRGRDRPYVVVNMAMTADGKIATANRAIESFGSAADQHHLLAVRASADAILCGAGTVNSPAVTLTSGGPRFEDLRRRRGLSPHPLRVIVSGRASLPTHAGVFHAPGGAVLVLVTDNAPEARRRRLQHAGAEVQALGSRAVDLPAALEWLAVRHRVRRLVCEGGGALNDAMFRAGLVDELLLTVCPVVFGGRQAPTIADGLGVAHLAEASPWRLASLRRVGNEAFLRFVRAG